MTTDQVPEAALLDDLAATADLHAKVAQAWQEFAVELIAAIPALPPSTHLDLALDPTASGTGDAVYGVTIEVGADGRLLTLGVGNASLPEGYRLGRDQSAALVPLARRPAGGRGRRHRDPGRFGDGLRPGTRQSRPRRRVLPGAHRGTAEREALHEAVRTDQPDADRPAVLHRRYGVGLGTGVRARLPADPPDAGRTGDDRARRRAGRPAARGVRRPPGLRRRRQAAGQGRRR